VSSEKQDSYDQKLEDLTSSDKKETSVFLAISNDKDIIDILQTFLHSNVEFLHVQGPLAGIQLTKNKIINYIIMDITFDPIEGSLACELIKKEFPAIPLIIITEYTEQKLKDEFGLINDFDGILNPKKLNKDTFNQAISNISEITTYQKRKTLLVLGLEKSGKKALIQKYLDINNLDYEIKGNRTFVTDQYLFKLISLPNSVENSIAKDDFRSCVGVVYIADSTLSNKMLEISKQWFLKIIEKNWINIDIPIILVASKFDSEHSSLSSLIKSFDLNKMTKKTERAFYIIGTSAVTNQGVNEAFAWLFNKIDSQNEIYSEEFIQFQTILILDYDYKRILEVNNRTLPISQAEIGLIHNYLNEKNDLEVFFSKSGTDYFVIKAMKYRILLKGHFTPTGLVRENLHKLLDKVINLIFPLNKQNSQMVLQNQFNFFVKQDFPSFFTSKIHHLSSQSPLQGLIVTIWHESLGPHILGQFSPQGKDLNAMEIALSCFVTTVSIFGHQGEVEPCFVSLPIKYASSEARIYFDSYKDTSVRGGERIFTFISLFSDLSSLNESKHDILIKKAALNFKQNQILKLDDLYSQILFNALE
jgi:CheY-like chemotaxis protein